MKKLMLISVVLCAVLVLSCEPEGTIDRIRDVNNAMTDPNSSIQITAENLQDLVGTSMFLVRAIPSFPYAKAILGALAIAQAILTIILGWRKHVNSQALKEVVLGNEIMKKGKDFKDAQNIAQSEATVELVNKIREKVA